MVSSRRLPRIFRFVLLALQLVLSGAAVVADAREEAEAARATVHIEAHTDKSCPVPHTADCPICQFLQSPAASSAPVAPPPPCTYRQHAATWAVVRHHAGWTPSSPLARGPPALS